MPPAPKKSSTRRRGQSKKYWPHRTNDVRWGSRMTTRRQSAARAATKSTISRVSQIMSGGNDGLVLNILSAMSFEQLQTLQEDVVEVAVHYGNRSREDAFNLFRKRMQHLTKIEPWPASRRLSGGWSTTTKCGCVCRQVVIRQKRGICSRKSKLPPMLQPRSQAPARGTLTLSVDRHDNKFDDRQNFTYPRPLPRPRPFPQCSAHSPPRGTCA